MGVESGPSVSIGPSIGVSIGPAISIGRGGFGSVNEGPVRGSLEGFRPMNITDIKPVDKGGVVAPMGEIVFNAQSLTAESAISQAEVIISEARAASNPAVPQVGPLLESSVVTEAKHWLGIVEPKQSISPLFEVQAVADSRVVPRQAVSPSASGQPEAVYAPAPQEQQEIKTEDRTDESPTVREEEETTELKLKYVEDEPVSSQRRYELREAIKKAKAEAQEQGAEEIEGWRIKKYFVPEHGGNRSGIAEQGTPDGSLVETYQVLSAENYESEREANEAVETTVTEKKPVKKAQEGNKVKERDIARVRRDPFLKRHPTEEVVARVVKKKILAEKLGQKPVVIHEIQAESSEGTIEDNPDLAEVFALPQAA